MGFARTYRSGLRPFSVAGGSNMFFGLECERGVPPGSLSWRDRYLGFADSDPERKTVRFQTTLFGSERFCRLLRCIVYG